MTGAAGAAAQAAKVSMFDWAVLVVAALSVALLVRELRAQRAAGPGAEEA